MTHRHSPGELAVDRIVDEVLLTFVGEGNLRVILSLSTGEAAHLRLMLDDALDDHPAPRPAWWARLLWR